MAEQATQLLRQTTRVRAVIDTPLGQDRVHYDIRYNGQDFGGTVAVNGVTRNVRFVNSTGYLNAPAAYWKLTLGAATERHPTALAAISDHWVSGPGTTKSILQLMSLEKLETAASQGLSGRAQLTATTQHGRPVYDLYDAAGNHFIVAGRGKPYLLEVRTFDEGQPIELSFSEYGSTPPVSAPPEVLRVDDF